MLSLHQMSACPLHKNIFQSCLAKCALSVQGGQESNSFFSAVEIMAFGSRRSFLINGIFSKTFDQTGWSINFFQFAMVQVVLLQLDLLLVLKEQIVHLLQLHLLQLYYLLILYRHL